MALSSFTDQLFEKYLLPAIPHSVKPNHITVLRFILTPFVVWFLIEQWYGPGFLLFLFTAMTDAVDGAMARSRNQITDWGKVYDPFADKLLILGVAFVIVPRFLGFGLLGILTLMEFTIFFAKFYIERYKIHAILEANKYGKIKMILYCIGLGSLIWFIVMPATFFLLLAKVFLYLSLIPALMSLVKYWKV